MTTTTHDRTRELLPWLVNESLEDDERREVEAHLASCADCRAELAATRQTFDVFAVHLPPAALTSYVAEPQAASWEVEGLPLQRSLVEEHLASCPSCRSEVELLRGGLAAIADGTEAEREPGSVLPFAQRPTPAPSRRLPAWLPVALAASLVFAVVSGGGWYVAHQRLDAREQTVAELEQRLDATHEAFVAAQRQAATAPGGSQTALNELQAQIAALEGQLKLSVEKLQATERQVADLRPAAGASAEGSRGPVIATLFLGTLRSGGDSAVVADPGAGLVFQVPLPPGELPREDELSYRVTDAGGAIVREGRPTLRRAEAGSMQDSYLSIRLDTAELPSGRLTLEVLDGGEVAASTAFRVP